MVNGENFFSDYPGHVKSCVIFVSLEKKKRKIRKKFFEKENERKDLNIMNK